jgi:PAS domain S-box-containing protein
LTSGSTWLPPAIAVGGLGFAWFLWWALQGEEQRQLRSLAEVEARNAALTLERTIMAPVRLFIRVAERHAPKLRATGAWDLELSGLEASAWIDRDGKVLWRVPPEASDELIASDLASSEPDREAVLAAKLTAKPAATQSTKTPSGDSVFRILVPFSENGELQGFVAGAFSGDTLHRLVLASPVARGWAFTVSEPGRELYRSGQPADGRWFAEGQAFVLNTRRIVRAAPTRELIERLRSPLPPVVLAAASVISVLLAIAVGLAQSARRRAREAESDVAARKQAEALAAKSEEQYRLLFEAHPQPMWVYDQETLAFLAVNSAALRHYGFSREEFLGMTLREIRPADEVKVLDEFVARRRRERDRDAFHSPRVWKHRKKDGTLIDVEISGSPLEFQGREAWLVQATDVTEKKRLETQLLQSQKMESVGRLAGGIAHDFNNLLGVIGGYAELLERDIAPERAGHGRLLEIQKAAQRAAALTRQLLAFSRKQVLEPKVLDFNEVVANIEKMLRRLIGEDIQLITVLDERIPRVKVDPGQIEQVIVNLAVNARDAMPSGGKLIIETGSEELDQNYVRTRPDARAGPHVMLAVSDTGQGMDAQTLSQIFEPFFTTKESGKGTGLGLATVHGIVRQSGGHVMVYSEPGRGTTFKIYLPAHSEEAQAPGAPEERLEPAPHGSEAVLVVEDEVALRVIISEILEAAGYEVLEAAGPEEATAIARSHTERIALILTDVILPRMSGRQLVDELRAAHPEARVLFMSGYTDDAIGHHGILEAGVHFLQKPFASDKLLRKLREILDAAS